MKRLLVLLVTTAALFIAAPVYAAGDEVCAMDDLTEQVACLRALHVEDAATIAGLGQQVQETRSERDLWISVAVQHEAQIEQLKAGETNLYAAKAYWMDKAFQHEAQIERLEANLTALDTVKTFWMDRAFKRAATIDRLREKIRTLEAR